MLFVVLGFIASMIAAVFGFGSAMFVLAIGPHIIPVGEAIALSAVLFAASTITKTIVLRDHLDWRIVGMMAIASVPFAYAGGLVLPLLDPVLAKRLLGLMILVYLCTQSLSLPRFKLATPGLLAGSALYGFLSGLLGSGSVIKVVMFRELNMTREAFVGAMAATSVLASIAKIGAYSQTGLLNANLFWPAIGLMVAASSSALMGRRFLRTISIAHFDLGVRVLLGVAALGLIW